ncbi:MAG: TonB C-terminal domain-containing protein [Deltaproteobacteria bacterium]|nr:TonB C-terminal domain-containing protein [Deltaproteobacteria bacterium]
MQPLPLQRYIGYSALIHLTLLLAALVIGPRVWLPKAHEPIDVVMIELPRGTSEDVGLGINETKTLPETPLAKETPPPLPPVPTKPPLPEPAPAMTHPRVQSKPPARPEVVPVDRKMDAALKKIDEQLRTRDKPPAMAQVKNPSEGSLYGTSDKPLAEIPAEAELMRYRAMVRAKILREWIPPVGTRDLPPNLRPRAMISVRINASGYITATNWMKQSDNAAFNASAMRAVQRATPLPAPPDLIRELALGKGFTVDFVVR